MSRAKLMVDLVKNKDELEMVGIHQAAADEKEHDSSSEISTLVSPRNTIVKPLELEMAGLHQAADDKNELTADKKEYHSTVEISAPNPILVSPEKIAISLIQTSQSAPKLADTDNDLITLEDLGIIEDEIIRQSSNPPTLSTIVTISPNSQISGIESLGCSSDGDYSDSGTSWYPDSEEDRRSKKNRRIYVDSTSSDSAADDAIPSKRKKNQPTCQFIVPPSDESTSVLSDTSFAQNTSVEPASTDPLVPSSTSSLNCLNSVQNSPSTSATSPKRWKNTDSSKWKKNITKEKRNNGLPYVSKAGKPMAAKQPKPVKCNISCRFECTKNFSDDDRKFLCSHYWQINDYTSKKQFLLYHVVSMPIKRMTVLTRDNKHRKATNAYYFSKNGEKYRVCKDFFLKTLCISNGPVNEAMKSRNEFGHFTGKDKRGSQSPVNKTSPEVEQRIVEHIKSFPQLESHYCRKKSKRQYLDSKLTIAKMYELYMEQLKLTREKPASIFVYRQIFGTKFNLSFFRPKKDLCLVCTRYHSSAQPADLKKEYDEHIIRKNSAQEAKDTDKRRSIEDPSYLVVTVDMQSTLQIPVSEIGILYYSRKLNVQNFTIHTAKPPNDAYCYLWNEINGKRGSVEIATALNCWFSELPPIVKEVTLYSDTCAGQNRNKFITAFLIHAVQRPNVQLESIEQKFLESGHTHMEVDSMHSAIEREARHSPIYSTIDWKSIMLRARSKRHRESAPPYIVRELTYEDMINVRELAEQFAKNINKDTEGKKVTWLKIKCLRVEKQNPGMVKIRYSHDGPYITLDMFQTIEKSTPRTRTRGQVIDNERGVNRQELIKSIQSYEPPKAYKNPLPISEAKKKDLMNLCVKGIIPQELHPWYASLPTGKDIEDRLCEPDVTEQDEMDEI